MPGRCRWSIGNLLVIGYSDALTPDFVPRVVEPVYQVKDQRHVLLGPPYQVEGGYVMGTVLLESDFEQAVHEGNATRIDRPLQAQPGYLLWVERGDLVARYEPEADVRRKLDECARRRIASGLRRLEARDYADAGLDAQIALNANRSCLAALGISAVIQHWREDDARLRMLARMVATIDPDVSIDRLIEWVECLAELNASVTDPSRSPAFLEAISRTVDEAAGVSSTVELNAAFERCRELLDPAPVHLGEPAAGPFDPARDAFHSGEPAAGLFDVLGEGSPACSVFGLGGFGGWRDERDLWAETPDLQELVGDLLRKAKGGS